MSRKREGKGEEKRGKKKERNRQKRKKESLIRSTKHPITLHLFFFFLSLSNPPSSPIYTSSPLFLSFPHLIPNPQSPIFIPIHTPFFFLFHPRGSFPRLVSSIPSAKKFRARKKKGKKKGGGDSEITTWATAWCLVLGAPTPGCVF